jgi:hypothetical protein
MHRTTRGLIHERAPVAVALALLMATASPAGQPVTVELVAGERVTAEVDSRTSSQQLWLRYASGNAQLLRAIEWDQVARATVDREDLDAAAFRQKALQLRTPYESPTQSRQRPQAETPRHPDPSPPPRFGAGAWSCRVESIWASAELANWDADPECEGLLLRVVPLNCFGVPVAVGGIVEAELWEDRVPRPRSLGRWTCPVPGPAAEAPAGGLVFIHRLQFISFEQK